MKNLYAILGVPKDATEKSIKKAYRSLALAYHPDKEGGSAERMKELNEAYNTLIDPAKRAQFDVAWDIFVASDEDYQPEIKITAVLNPGHTLPHSFIYKQKHHAFVTTFQTTPLPKQSVPYDDILTIDETYLMDEIDGSQKKIVCIFSFIKAKEQRQHPSLVFSEKNRLQVNKTISLFQEFLSGKYIGDQLRSLQTYLTAGLNVIKKEDNGGSEIVLYEGISEIINMTYQDGINVNRLMSSLNKITDYATRAATIYKPSIISLFRDPHYRRLFSHTQFQYWLTDEDLFSPAHLSLFDGLDEAKEFIKEIRQRLSRESGNEQVPKQVLSVKLLCRLEKTFLEAMRVNLPSVAYRDAAFGLLDWFPALMGLYDSSVMINIFLQIGMVFQLAARAEESIPLKQADEQLAMSLYLTAVGLASRSTPDIEQYVSSQIIRYGLHFEFADANHNEIITALIKRNRLLMAIYPMVERPQTSVHFAKHESKNLAIMRELLHALVNDYERYKQHPDTSLAHPITTILYHAYEACLKNWYLLEHDSTVEETLRLDLMDELLLENKWTFFDVEEHLNSPWIMVNRDERGWIKPSRTLGFNEAASPVYYRAINGATFHTETGEISFYLVPWTPNRPVYEKTFTLFDLEDMLAKNITGAIFSLDPVDTEKEYHPFNLMRFSPPQLADSELLHSMLLTDYILKFLTTNQEVNGAYPFAQRPVANMIEHLPIHLKKIINDFHAAKHYGSLHRFWIEAEDINVGLGESPDDKNITNINLGELKMVVKKHKMKRDLNGELKDISDEEEGWPVYVLTKEEMLELEQGIRIIPGHAMIYIHKTPQLYYWENNSIICSHQPVNYQNGLLKLFLVPTNASKKIVPSNQNKRILYRTTRDMAEQTGMSHRYSPEFIFAHEFSLHYDEFAQFLAEFGRLKELSKMTVVTRVLHGLHQNNQASLQAATVLSNHEPQRNSLDTPIYAKYFEQYEKIINQIGEDFTGWRKKLSTLENEISDKLYTLKRQIGSLTVDESSWEVSQAYNNLFRQSLQFNPYVSHSQILARLPSRQSIAERLTNAKRDEVCEQLKKMNRDCSYRAIYAFLDGNNKPWMDELLHEVKENMCNQIHQAFPKQTLSLISEALQPTGEAKAKELAAQEAQRLFADLKDKYETIETGFKKIHFASEEQAQEEPERCFWVPASARHDVVEDTTIGRSRYSFFVYGGVNVQPRINQTNAGNRGPAGTAVGSGAFNRQQITRGFQQHHIIHQASRNHDLLRAAVFNINSRANLIYLPTHAHQHPTRSIHNGGHLRQVREGVEKRMQEIHDTGKAQGWGPAQYRHEIRTMLSELRQDLRAGNIALNRHHRPHAT